MAKNRGKQFEEVVRECFEKVPHTAVNRLPDPVMGYLGYRNICDFIVYNKPYEYYIECKSVHGNLLSIHSKPKLGRDGRWHGFYGAITDTQWEGLLEKSEIKGVFAGVMCWWIDKDITRFIPIQMLEKMRNNGAKSIRYDVIACNGYHTIDIIGKKKRVFFDYNMEEFFNVIKRDQHKQS